MRQSVDAMVSSSRCGGGRGGAVVLTYWDEHANSAVSEDLFTVTPVLDCGRGGWDRERGRAEMPLRNRVTPLGDLIADPARGLVYGNRGCLHDDTGHIR